MSHAASTADLHQSGLHIFQTDFSLLVGSCVAAPRTGHIVRFPGETHRRAVPSRAHKDLLGIAGLEPGFGEYMQQPAVVELPEALKIRA